jgi:hypothetical protein
MDVGYNGIDLLSHLNIPLKVSLDLRYPLRANGIISVHDD